jgi:hypothetical protein
VSQCYASEKFFLFGQVLEDDHGYPVNGIPHVDESPENPLTSHHMFYAVSKNFVTLIQNRTREGLNTIPFHELMLDTDQMFSSAKSTPPMKRLYILIIFFSFSLPCIFYRLQNKSFQQMQPNIYLYCIYSHPTCFGPLLAYHQGCLGLFVYATIWFMQCCCLSVRPRTHGQTGC